MSETFRCGHPKTPENTKTSPSNPRGRCRRCLNDMLAQRHRSTGGKRGRPIVLESAPIPITAEDHAWHDMVRVGSAQLGHAIDRLLGRCA